MHLSGCRFIDLWIYEAIFYRERRQAMKSEAIQKVNGRAYKKYVYTVLKASGQAVELGQRREEICHYPENRGKWGEGDWKNAIGDQVA